MIDEALIHYRFDNPSVELIRHNENMTYRVIDGEKSYVLRIHSPSQGFNVEILRPGKDRADVIAEEIKLLGHLTASGNMQTQRVVLNNAAEAMTRLGNGMLVTVLEWIEGVTLENVEITPEIACELGVMIGKLHNELSQNTLAHRYCYDAALLSRMMDEADRALAQGHFIRRHAAMILETLAHIRSYLADARDRFILVHSDLGKSNLIYRDDIIIPIDFSLSGYCVPEMDVASAFSHIGDEALNQRILCGYRSMSEHKVDDLGIEICFCLQILLFVISQHHRFAGEAWFQERLEDWCEKRFAPLARYS